MPTSLHLIMPIKSTGGRGRWGGVKKGGNELSLLTLRLSFSLSMCSLYKKDLTLMRTRDHAGLSGNGQSMRVFFSLLRLYLSLVMSHSPTLFFQVVKNVGLSGCQC